MNRRTLGKAAAAVVAIAVASGVAGLTAHHFGGTPSADLPLFMLTLAATGWAGLLAGWAFQRWTSPLGFGARIIIFTGLGIGVFIVNTAVAAWLMFISTHDFRLLVVLCAYALAATAIPALTLGRSLGSRLQRVERAAERIAAGDLSARAYITGSDDIARLATAFDTMATRLQESDIRRDAMEKSRRELFAAISHDLRTPLSSFRVMVDALTDGIVTDEETSKRYFRTMSSDIDQLSLLIDDLFELARIDSGALQLRFEQVAVDEIVAIAVDAAMPGAEQVGVRLSVAGALKGSLIDGDPQRLTRVLSNLLQNAIRHTPADGTVVVSVENAGPEVIIAVEDTGEGIPQGDVGLVFERFYRSEKARSRAAGGSGLGLSIARGIVEAHGGRIWVDSTSSAGTVLKMALPDRS